MAASQALMAKNIGEGLEEGEDSVMNKAFL